ncbi:sugar phosphate isomerase/epimerase [Thermaerobacter sp. PB12/4term]|uniref:sugar phosphate isomerase/epimerase family protein n=1 Tax=Thermaerobacter sp. PB12/4term TaxID=2293838 RepID=UPI000E32B74C|nr:sugar phosphate isomerase/epimerase family protein [Thermaerobacter sp. PB12/4term]QIA27848.1 sugar phosphate isomerase/epimerase [Thermaerobacter sp. PB12/4term]
MAEPPSTPPEPAPPAPVPSPAGPARSPHPVLALPCRSLWRSRHRPEDPDRFLASLRDEARRLGRQGAGAVEFHADACVLDARYAAPGPWREAGAILAAEGLAATVHLPYVWPDLTALDQTVWEGSIASIVTALRATSPLTPLLAAVHPANYATQALVLATPADQRPGLLDELATRLVAALRRLQTEVPPATAAVLALENLEGMPWALFDSVARAAGVAVCLDVGHAVSNGDDPVQLARTLGGRIRGLHLHDAVPPAGQGTGGAAVGRAHLPLGQGSLRLPELAAALAETGFAGPVVLELETGDALEAAIEKVRAAWSTAYR